MNVVVNMWAVVACAVASVVIGSIWYGPLFGKMYMSARGMDQWPQEKRTAMKNKMLLSYVGQFIASLVMFYILATFIVWSAPVLNVRFAMGVSFFMWLGFVVPLAFGETLWGGKKTLFWLSIGNMLVTLLVGGAIIGVWK
jgi:Protein of unknown function (DUF1761)